jgi:hypothetical protein
MNSRAGVQPVLRHRAVDRVPLSLWRRWMPAPAASFSPGNRAVEQTEGRGLIRAPSCVMPATAPASHLQIVRDTLITR